MTAEGKLRNCLFALEETDVKLLLRREVPDDAAIADVIRRSVWAKWEGHEINTVRKHMSGIKGGRLAQLAFPATMIALILSDVIGDDLDVIGSGPTVADRSRVEDAIRVLKKYSIARPSTPFQETPKPGDAALSLTQNIMIGSNRQAIHAAAREARSLGYRTLVLSAEEIRSLCSRRRWRSTDSVRPRSSAPEPMGPTARRTPPEQLPIPKHCDAPARFN